MLDDVFVIDAVSHGYHLAPEVAVPSGMGPAWNPESWVAAGYAVFRNTLPEGSVLDFQRWMRGADPELIAHALFAESYTDATIYHEVPLDRMFYEDGTSPIWCGAQMRERWPSRVELYGGVSPYRPDALDRVDMLVDEYGVKGIKMYPVDLVDGRVVPIDMADPEVCFPVYERARERGVKIIAIHKAIPVGPTPIKPLRVDDMDGAALAFPDLVFEIVHGGFAFLEETALQVSCFPNIVINLEGTTLFLPKAPRRFAEIIGSLLASGGEDRIMWASGCMAGHPQPMLDAFWNLEMPEDLVEGYGYPPLTKEIKRKILGLNAADIIGLDIEEMKRGMAGDEFSARQELAPMWEGNRAFDLSAYRAAAVKGYASIPVVPGQTDGTVPVS
ncbi:amidohydrolase family protein [Streptomyces sp. NPDC006872]|uniref:amidohydrolase family protein n=1 Tax=Streptomyces sp. NPDC006872 TaxID=3155720 RepID=UPI00340CA2D3